MIFNKNKKLHPMFDDHELPYCLRKPLIFGDIEQRKALNDLKVRIDKILKRQAIIDQGELIMFNVKMVIYAYDQDDVEEAICDIARIIEIESVRIIKE